MCVWLGNDWYTWLVFIEIMYVSLASYRPITHFDWRQIFIDLD
jgi:hypothetical protein